MFSTDCELFDMAWGLEDNMTDGSARVSNLPEVGDDCRRVVRGDKVATKLDPTEMTVRSVQKYERGIDNITRRLPEDTTETRVQRGE